jgi:hypothetical protein
MAMQGSVIGVIKVHLLINPQDVFLLGRGEEGYKDLFWYSICLTAQFSASIALTRGRADVLLLAKWRT